MSASLCRHSPVRAVQMYPSVAIHAQLRHDTTNVFQPFVSDDSLNVTRSLSPRQSPAFTLRASEPFFEPLQSCIYDFPFRSDRGKHPLAIVWCAARSMSRALFKLDWCHVTLHQLPLIPPDLIAPAGGCKLPSSDQHAPRAIPLHPNKIWALSTRAQTITLHSFCFFL